MNAGILAQGQSPVGMPNPLLGSPSPIPVPYGGSAPDPAVSLYGDPFWKNVSLLLRFDGAHGSTAYSDASVFGNAVAAGGTGSPTISATVAKFGSSVYCNGSNWIEIPHETSAAPFAFGTGDFTVECWFNVSSLSIKRTIFDTRPNSTNGAYLLINLTTNGSIVLYVSSADRIVSTPERIRVNEWYHVAVSRVSGTTRMFVNGQTIGSWVDATNYTQPTNRAGRIGTAGFFSAGGETMLGFFDEFRVTKGIGRYSSPFIPQTSPHIGAGTATAGRDPFWSSVVMLGRFYGNNNATTFVDHSPVGRALTANGGAIISTAQARLYGASAYFDGNGDYISTPSSSDFAFGTGDFTAEAWLYVPSFGSGNLNWFTTTGGSSNFSFYFTTTGQVSFWSGSSNSTFGSAGAIPTGSWFHIACARANGYVRAYVNGAKIGNAASVSASIANNAAINFPATASYPASTPCYMTDLRITKGVARYGNSFTPPSGPLPSN